MHAITKADAKKSCAARGFKDLAEWAKENRKWAATLTARTNDNGRGKRLAEALDNEYRDYLEPFLNR